LKNIGDAFCFLVLTDPEDTKKPQQVIAKTVVQQRYPKEAPPIVEKTFSKKLSFYKTDGISPLGDPLASDKTIPITDLIAD
jgi:hypothetical protein